MEGNLCIGSCDNKTVTFHLSERGALTTSDKSFADVSGPVAADAANDTLMTLPYVAALEHVCGRNQYGLTVQALRAIDPAKFAEPNGGIEVRDRCHVTDQEWQEIRALLRKLHEHEVDSPIEKATTRSDAAQGMDNGEAVLPAPPPDSS